MKVIRARFRKFRETSLYEALSEVGVYVAWAEGTSLAPYIGEGNVVERLSSHDKATEYVLDGVAAMLPSKQDAEIVEALLIDCARSTGVIGPQSQRSGNWRAVEQVLRKARKLRVHVVGQDPFQCPRKSRVRQSKWIEVAVDRDGEPVYSCPWNRRT